MEKGQKYILVADDERPMARALELKLAHEGFKAKAVFDGTEVLESLRHEKFDLLLLDLVMPTVDGFQVLESMKSEGILVPVIVLSNLSQQEDEKRVKELGAREFFIKSDTPITDVIHHVKKVLG